MPPSPRVPNHRFLFEDHEASTQTDDAGFFMNNDSSADSAIEDDNAEDEDDQGDVVGFVGRLSRLFTPQQQQQQRQQQHHQRRQRGHHDRGTQTAKDPLAAETEKLSFDVIFFVLGKRKEMKRGKNCTTFSCVRRNVSQMLEKHRIVFTSMVNRLAVTMETDLKGSFGSLSDELFARNEVTWSKIIALFAFGARLAQYCQERGMGPAQVLEVCSVTAAYAVEKLSPFLKRHGGWSTICEAFPSDDIAGDFEAKMWNTLIITGLGLTAAAAFLAMSTKS